MSKSITPEMTRRLVDCAMGRLPADKVIRNGRWVSVQTGEVIPATDVAVLGERIAYVGPDASHTIGEKTEVVDAQGAYLVPGLLDAHMHVESGMLTVTEFVRAVAPHGTTGMFIDPHEIANVFGLKGVRLMVDEAAMQPIHVFVQVPSCVPSAPGLETPGASIGPEEVAEAMTWPGIIGLGEMMDFPGVFQSREKPHAEMAIARNAGKTVGGHYASPDLGLPFHGYVAGGAEDDHEGTRLEDAVARARQGMRVMMRYGSAWHDVATQVRAVTELGLDARRFLLCTDDSHSATLVQEGHMDRVVRHAIAQGLRPVTAIQMATINTAEHFGVSRDLGMIAPGRFADILLVPDLVNFRPTAVMAKGQWIAREGQWLIELPTVAYPDWALHSVHLKRLLTAEDFKLVVPEVQQGQVTANVIGVIENQAPTRHLRLTVEVTDGEIKPDIPRDLAKIALVERHRASGIVQVGLVHGFGFTERCGIATTVAHDSHHLIVVGTDEVCMAQAVNALAECGGGQVVVKDGEIIGKVELPIAGLMSNQRAEVVAAQAESVLEGFRACGCRLNNPNMQLSLLALVVIPELRISDLGLVDVTQFKFIPVVER
ncbi:adenine deaminase [uncultured Thermanaerothrix sp.]|uniref:adenine deaminase n=1 Tax=uncultured Thermanaerothrix sp. TaxID=1195149 RepID=UPI00261E5426|nr:adenine deaminase [uncultured Thermanaerothrix sp.]